jgi:CheY-like chemotaxis protein
LTEELKTILVVDDCDFVLEVLVATLKAAFLVLQANSGSKAIKLAAGYADRIDLLLAAVEMRGMSGPYLAEALRKSRPEIRVMLSCGDILVGDFGCTLIQKPFMPAKLIEMVRVVLHAPGKSHVTRQFSAGSAE